jgi:hypothetical protein
MTFDGNLPYLLWSRPSPVGERVRVWLPAGLSVKDIEVVSEKLASACWARDARVTVKKANASIVLVDIVRRDAFGADVSTTDLIDQLPEPVTPFGNVVPLPKRQDVIDQLAPTDDAVITDAANSGTHKSSGKPTSSTDSVKGFGGMDVTDYV